MPTSKTSVYAALGVAAVLAAAGLTGTSRQARAGGEGCCSGKASATAMPVAMTSANPADCAKQCPSAKAAAMKDGACMDKAATMARPAAMTNVPPAVHEAMMSFSRANAAVAKAVDSGATDSEIRKLAVKAGGAYAELLRTTSQTYRSSAKTGVSYAAWTTDMVGDCGMAASCAMSGDCGMKSDKAAKPASNLRAELP